MWPQKSPLSSHSHLTQNKGPISPVRKGPSSLEPLLTLPPGWALPTYRRTLLPLPWPQGSPQLWGPELEGERQDQGSRNF